MSIVPVPIVVPDDAAYDIDPPATNAKLNDPSHAGLHGQVNDAVDNLHQRVKVTEQNINNLWPQVDQARLASHSWVVKGPLDVAYNQLLMPLVWNMTGDAMLFSAARATVLTPPEGASVQVDLYTGHDLTGGTLDTGTVTSILDAPLVIPIGQYSSPTVGAAGFVENAFHAADNYVVAVVRQVGSSAPGADLTIQLDRLL